MTTEKIEVVAPLRVSERKIHDFVTAQQDWIVAATDKVIKNKLTVQKLAPETYKAGVMIPYQGDRKLLLLKRGQLKKAQVSLNQEGFTVTLPIDNNEINQHPLIRLTLIEWMQNQAAKEVKRLVDIYAEKYNLYPRYVRIKTQKSRWGSCGIHNDINLNWLLILAPEKVMEYVVIHELCHIKERNHSADFWRLVEKHCPDYKKHRGWLKQHGRNVMQGL